MTIMPNFHQYQFHCIHKKISGHWKRRQNFLQQIDPCRWNLSAIRRINRKLLLSVWINGFVRPIMDITFWRSIARSLFQFSIHLSSTIHPFHAYIYIHRSHSDIIVYYFFPSWKRNENAIRLSSFRGAHSHEQIKQKQKNQILNFTHSVASISHVSTQLADLVQQAWWTNGASRRTNRRPCMLQWHTLVQHALETDRFWFIAISPVREYNKGGPPIWHPHFVCEVLFVFVRKQNGSKN